MLTELLTGEACTVFVPTHRVPAFMAWCKMLHRPDKSQVLAVVKRIAGFRPEERRRLPKLWKFEARIDGVAIFAIRYMQVRLYCCLQRDDLVILEWCRKKSNKADRAILARAASAAVKLRGS